MSSNCTDSNQPTGSSPHFLAANKEIKRARALFSFESREDDELSLRAGEIMGVLEESDRHWWKVRSHRGTGLVPSNYISTLLKPGRKVRALHKFKAERPGELTLEGGDIITVLDDSKTCWWKGETTSGTGYFPAKYVLTCASPPQATTASKGKTKKVRAFCDFEAKEDEELGFRAGEVIAVLDDTNNIWWKGKTKSGTGIFPVAHVLLLKPVDTDKIETFLMLIGNSKTTSISKPDSKVMLKLEEQCSSMRPLVESNIEDLEQDEEELQAVFNKVEDALGLYRKMLAEAPRLCSVHQLTVKTPAIASPHTEGSPLTPGPLLAMNHQPTLSTSHPLAPPPYTSELPEVCADSSSRHSSSSILMPAARSSSVPYQQTWQPVPLSDPVHQSQMVQGLGSSSGPMAMGGTPVLTTCPQQQLYSTHTRFLLP